MQIRLSGPKTLDVAHINNLLVQGESGVDCFDFSIPKQYGDVDLSELVFKVRIVSEQDTITEQLLEKTVDDQNLTLSCTVTQDMTAVSGVVYLQVVGESKTGEQIIKYTAPGIYIRPNLAGQNPPPQDYLEAMLSRMTAEFAQSIQKVNDKAAAAETAADTAVNAAGEAEGYADSMTGNVQAAQEAAAEAVTAATEAAAAQISAQTAANTAEIHADRAKEEADHAAAIVGFDPDTKVDKIPGKGLSSNDYTDQDKMAVDSLPADVLGYAVASEAPVTFEGEEVTAQANGQMVVPQTYTKAVYDPRTGEPLQEMLSGFCNGNLLVNPAFSVNQRGKSSYTETGYTVDCWKLTSGTLNVVSGGVTLNGTLVQILEYAAGSDVTASVEMQSGEAAASYDNASRQFTITSAGGTIKRAKLERGTISTIANDAPPHPQQELAKCQRYYVPATTRYSCGGFILSAGTFAKTTVPLSVPMRANPALIVTNVGSVRSADGSVVVPTSITLGNMKDNQALLSIEGNFSGLKNQAANWVDGVIGFDAGL